MITTVLKINFRCLSQILIAVGLFFLPVLLVRAEVITDFVSTYTINQDGTVDVWETVSYDFESAERHGIFRTLEETHAQAATKKFFKRLVDIEITTVKQDAVLAEYEVTRQGSEVEIKIGDPDSTLTGLHTYEIGYRLTGALSYGPDGAELYWNATGNEWPVQINQAQITVVGAKPGILSGHAACYVGTKNDTTSCTSISTTTDTTVFTASQLAPEEGVTVAQAVDAGQVQELIVEKLTIMWVLWLLGGGWLIGLCVWAWRFKHQNKFDKPIIAQYEPYENFLPMYTGLLFDFRLDPHDITAGIIYLAEQGFLAIKKTEKKLLLIFTASDYEITLRREFAEIPTSFLKEVCSLLFAPEAPVLSTVLLSSLLNKRVKNSKIILALQAALKTDLVGLEFTETQYQTTAKSIFGTFFVGIALLYGLFAAIGALDMSALPLLALLTIFTVIIYSLANYNRRSKKGYEALHHLQGFKLFLSLTEKDRYTFFNAPEKSPELFMQYLPYAIALKVEKDWAKVFAGITIPNPEWYSGSNVGAFSAAAFTNDMSTFATNFSSSSGTSGSSGGGSSGGGGGGGGGGSW